MTQLHPQLYRWRFYYLLNRNPKPFSVQEENRDNHNRKTRLLILVADMVNITRYRQLILPTSTMKPDSSYRQLIRSTQPQLANNLSLYSLDSRNNSNNNQQTFLEAAAAICVRSWCFWNEHATPTPATEPVQ